MALKDVREAIAEALSSIEGLDVHPYWSTLSSGPAAMLKRTRGPYRKTLGGQPTVHFELMVLVALTDLDSNQISLDEYTDTDGVRSIRAALEADETLNGVVEDMLIGDWGPDTGIAHSGVEFIAATLPLEVWMK